MPKKYTVLDLFAGAGGLSLGFTNTGRFRTSVAVENNLHAQKTYKRNHPGTNVCGDIREIKNYERFEREYGPFDVVIGGPPCQGFSNANRQRHQLISHNNNLVKAYVRAISELKPRAFLMENVSTLRSDVHRFYCSAVDQDDIDSLGIDTREDVITLLKGEAAVPDIQEWLLNRKAIEELLLPPKLLQLLNLLLIKSADRSKVEKRIGVHGKRLVSLIDIRLNYISTLEGYDGLAQFEREVLSSVKLLITLNGKQPDSPVQAGDMYVKLHRMLEYAKELLDNEILVDELTVNERGVFARVRSYSVMDYVNKTLGVQYEIDAGLLNAADFGVPQQRVRFFALGLRKDIGGMDLSLPSGNRDDKEFATVHDAISDLQTIEPKLEISDSILKFPVSNESVPPLARVLRDSQVLHNHVTTKTTPIALKRYAEIKQGQNFHNLSRELVEDTYSDPTRTQNTIYRRLDYGEPSVTVLNVRKSMWIHPILNRAISIREAARLQSFPDSFVFEGPKDAQYQQIGNAVPPMLAEAIAEQIATALDKRE